jgi:hypothetical protein
MAVGLHKQTHAAAAPFLVPDQLIAEGDAVKNRMGHS